jgi:RNA-directed DNA polymerase
MQPIAAARTWNIPSIESATRLAAWLGITDGELEWFADLKGLERNRKTHELLRNYHYRLFAKKSGSVRLIESPKPRLKELQRLILDQILNQIQIHHGAHGFRKGRSITTFAAPHVGQQAILRMDLMNFFPSISRARVQAIFRAAGYPESVADLLGGICTNVAPRDVWTNSPILIEPLQLNDTRTLYAEPHLPQGAPTSPALANICCYRMDCRLAGLAKSVDAKYTRYADDLAFSGGKRLGQCVDRFSLRVAVILHEEGFAVHHRKTRLMRQSVRQQLAGLVVNQQMNVKRVDFDRLKATLTNCVRLGPESQNRNGHPNFKEHLNGRVGFIEMVNSAKAQRLRKLWEQVVWP